jgi:uncharacterized protein (DUF1778 family)
MARPKKQQDRLKATYYRFRCTMEEKELIDRAAALRSLDASAWGRSELVGMARRIVAREQPPTKRG